MSTLATALGLRRLLRESAALRLLRADLAPVAAAALLTHLSAPGQRIATDELHERIDADLMELRDHFDLGARSGKAYCDDWRSAGFLLRRPVPGARGETYELSPDAIDALRVLTQLQAPSSTVTESRLVTLMSAMHRLAVDTDPDSSRRLAALRAERGRIDAEIERVRAGDVDTLDERAALERVRDLLLQAQDVPADFARVRARFAQLNHDLRASILTAEGNQSAVLDDVFRGVDLIESSDEGRTFTAFSSLIRDPERSAQFDADVADVLERDFTRALPPASRRALRTFVRQLKNGSRDVHGVLTEFARGLRRYVHSQEFQRDRAMRHALQQALASAVPASSHLRPYDAIGLDLDLTSMRLASVGELHLHDPSDVDTGDVLADDEPTTVDLAALAALARETEIDFAELATHINATLRAAATAEHAAAPSVTVADVLRAHPASQGVASIVGLLSLATRHGRADPDHQDDLEWIGADGLDRHARVLRHVFDTEVEP